MLSLGYIRCPKSLTPLNPRLGETRNVMPYLIPAITFSRLPPLPHALYPLSVGLSFVASVVSTSSNLHSDIVIYDPPRYLPPRSKLHSWSGGRTAYCDRPWRSCLNRAGPFVERKSASYSQSLERQAAFRRKINPTEQGTEEDRVTLSQS